VAVPHPVDQLNLVVVEMADDLAREDLRLVPVVLVDPELAEDRGPRRSGLRLLLGVNLEQAVVALDDLHPRAHPSRLEGDIGEPVDLDAGRDLDIKTRVAGKREEPLGDGPDKGRVLRLQIVEKDIGP